MSVLPIHTYGSAVLRKKAQPVRQLTNETVKLIMDMFETMRNADGIGLAANQIGVLRRIIVIDLSDMEVTKDLKPIVFMKSITCTEFSFLITSPLRKKSCTLPVCG